MKIRIGLLCAICLVLFPLSAAPRPELEKRGAEIVPLLAETPNSLGVPITGRAAWAGVAGTENGARILAEAEKVLRTAPEALSEALFLDYSRTGRRAPWEDPYEHNRRRLRSLALAECLENRGRFLPALEEAVASFLSLKTWVKPAHDAKLDNFHGRRKDIDLESSSLAFELALILRLLPGRLPPSLAESVRKNIESRVLEPYRDMVYDRIGMNYWLHAGHNWNAVCHAGVIGTALTLPLPKFERALYIAAAEHYLPYYIEGFQADGYCVEGVSYWNYGFGHYVLLAETVLRATNGKIDFLAGPAVRKIAEYGFGIEMAPGLAPAFGDTDTVAAPERRLLTFLKRRLGLSQGVPGPAGNDILFGPLQQILMFLFPNSADAQPEVGRNDPPAPRTYFRDAGVLILRPPGESGTGLSAAVKSGRDAGSHNHNDTGSFMAAVDGDPVLVDPGAEAYTARTFSARRYESRLVNSWGHPVPVVAGSLQKTGVAAAAVVRSLETSADRDVYSLDLTACYDAPALKSLRREFVYSRKDGGELSVRDTAEFSRPELFETAFITFGTVRAVSPKEILVFGKRGTVSVTIEASGSEVAVKIETIDEETRAGVKATRVGISPTRPAQQAAVFLRIRPYRPPPPPACSPWRF